MATERKPYLLRLDPRVLDALQRWARDDLRSLNAQIDFLLRQALTKAGRASTNSIDSDSRPSDSATDSPSPA